jgi:hypothetical protein
MQPLTGDTCFGVEGFPGTESGRFVAGAIVDSWIEPARAPDAGACLVLQVAPRQHPDDLIVIESDPRLVRDPCWLDDLGENHCHGSPVMAIGSWAAPGELRAEWLYLTR